MFKGNVSVIPMPVSSNAGEAFSNLRKHGADGTIAQAYGGSSISDWLGDSAYATERMTAGRANGTFAPENISKSKQAVFDTGHDYEKAIAIHNARLMSIEFGIECVIHDASKEEYRNDAWSSMAAHLDFFLEVKKGRIMLNPGFVIGGPEKNYIIVPDLEDHWYIADSKSVQSRFGTNWSEKDEMGIPVGGMKHGIAPTHYRQQMLAYSATLMPSGMIDGAILLAACGLSKDDHAQVFVPYDQAEAEAMMDEVEKRNAESLKGNIPSVTECKDVAKAIEELPLQYPDVNKDKRILELTDPKWANSFARIKEIDKEVSEIDEVLKPYAEELKKRIFDETGMKLKSLSLNTDSKSKLKDERADILMLPLEEVKDGPACYFVDKETGEVSTIEYASGIKWDAKAKAAVAEDYPELFDDLRHRFPERKPRLTVGKADPKKIGKTK